MVTLRFVFNQDKLKQAGKTEDEMLAPMRDHAKKYEIAEPEPVFPPEITDLPGSNRMNLKKPVPQTPRPGKKRRRTCTGKRRKPCVTI